MDILTHINPTVWESPELMKCKRLMKSCCQNDGIKTVKIIKIKKM